MQIHVQGDCPEGIVLIDPAFLRRWMRTSLLSFKIIMQREVNV